MPYTKTAWVDNTTPAISAANLNKIENAVFAASQFFNPKDSAYGAVGDGVTDDTTAIQNCSNAAMAVNGVVVFPPGTYVVSTVIPANNFHWWAPSPTSVTIQHKAGTYRGIIDNTLGSALSNFSVENISFVGNGQDSHTTVNGTQTITNGQNLLVNSTATLTNNTWGFVWNPASGSTVGATYNYASTSGGNTLVNVTGLGAGKTFTNGDLIDEPAYKMPMYIVDGTNCVVRGCDMSNWYGPGVEFFGYNNVLVEKNNLLNTCLMRSGGNAINLQNSTTVNSLSDFIIRDNLIDTGATCAINISDNLSVNANQGFLRGAISNNIIKNWPQWAGITLEPGYFEELVIEGNVVMGCALGIACNDNNVYTGVSTANRVVISNNLIDSGTAALSTTYGNGLGIQIEGSDMTVSGNVIRTGSHGIVLINFGGGSENKNIAISGNSIQLAPKDLTTLASGIFIGNVTRGITISGNTISRMNCHARGAQTGVTTLAVDSVVGFPDTGTIRKDGGSTAVTYTSITQATRAGGGATINGLSAAITVTDQQLVHLNAAGSAINMSNTLDTVISGNMIVDAPQHGILANSSNTRCKIIGNEILNCGTDMGGSQKGIWLNSGNTDFQIEHNAVQDPQALTNYGYYITAGNTNTQLRDNYFNNGTASYSFAYFAGTASDVAIDRGNRKGNTHVPNGGVSSQSVGAVTVVNIAHGLLTTPTVYSAVPANAAARDKAAPVFAVTADATNIIITYAAAFPTGPQTVNYAWTAYV